MESRCGGAGILFLNGRAPLKTIPSSKGGTYRSLILVRVMLASRAVSAQQVRLAADTPKNVRFCKR